MTLKSCYKCKLTKTLSEFSKDRCRTSGYCGLCKNCCSLKNKKYREINRESLNKKLKRYYLENKEKWTINRNKRRNELNAYNRKYENYKYRTNLNFKLKVILRSRLQNITKSRKSGSAVRDLGCTIPELKQHLEQQFKPGMTWKNYGFEGWHIDHIIPLSSFDLTNRDNVKIACHYTNLQPLWAEENLSKGDKIADAK